jgi:hypothetical protein
MKTKGGTTSRLFFTMENVSPQMTVMAIRESSACLDLVKPPLFPGMAISFER